MNYCSLGECAREKIESIYIETSLKLSFLLLLLGSIGRRTSNFNMDFWYFSVFFDGFETFIKHVWLAILMDVWMCDQHIPCSSTPCTPVISSYSRPFAPLLYTFGRAACKAQCDGQQ